MLYIIVKNGLAYVAMTILAVSLKGQPSAFIDRAAIIAPG